jgi:hypothetical protein
MSLYPAIVNGLPRPMPGESVTVPWAACVAAYVVTAVVPAYLFTRPAARGAAARAWLLIGLAAFAWLMFWKLGAGAVLSKAWRRGL